MTGSRRPSLQRSRGERPKSQPNDPASLHQPSPATRRNSSNGMGFVEEVAINPGPLVDVVEACVSAENHRAPEFAAAHANGKEGTPHEQSMTMSHRDWVLLDRHRLAL